MFKRIIFLLQKIIHPIMHIYPLHGTVLTISEQKVLLMAAEQKRG